MFQVTVYAFNWLNKLAKEVDKPYYYAFNNETSTLSVMTANMNGDNVHGELMGGPTVFEAYVTALYFTLSCMTSVGFGNVSSSTVLEKVFTVCMMILGGEWCMIQGGG